MTKISKIYTKDTINDYVYVERITYGIFYGGSKLCSHVVFNLTME